MTDQTNTTNTEDTPATPPRIFKTRVDHDCRRRQHQRFDSGTGA